MKPIIPIFLGLCVALLRFVPENNLIMSAGDAQGGIALMAALVIAVFIFIISTLLFFRMTKDRGALRIIWISLGIGVIGYQLSKVQRFHVIEEALASAADPHSEPSALVSLNGFDTVYFGYEIDNRLALNPNSPKELLRALYEKNQMGTKRCLARNPNTPVDILDKLSGEGDEWMNKSLQRNPAFKANKTEPNQVP